jgi:hypothetical protein
MTWQWLLESPGNASYGGCAAPPAGPLDGTVRPQLGLHF